MHQQSKSDVKRVGMVIKLKPECVEQYLALHHDSNAGVRDLLAKYHMKNFSIFLHQIGNDWFEFGYYEYDGTLTTGELKPVRWIIGKYPIYLNIKQIECIAKPARPIQDLDGRIILLSR